MYFQDFFKVFFLFFIHNCQSLGAKNRAKQQVLKKKTTTSNDVVVFIEMITKGYRSIPKVYFTESQSIYPFFQKITVGRFLCYTAQAFNP